jgi:hypothetical protein
MRNDWNAGAVMAEHSGLTVKQQLNEAAAAVTAAEQRVAAAQQALSAVQGRRLEAEAASPETTGVVYADPAAWRAAHDAVGHAWSLERKAAEVLAAAENALAEAQGQQAAAQKRNLIEHRRAILGKLGRRGGEVERLIRQLAEVDLRLKARPVHTREVVARWVGVLGSQLKGAGLSSTLPQDPAGRDWTGFETWSERLMTDHLALSRSKQAVGGSPWQTRIGADEEI